MAPKESFSAKQLRLKQQQEAEEDEATAERIEREMAEEINAQAEQNAFRSLGLDGHRQIFSGWIPAWVNIAGALLGVLQLSYRIEQERERRADDYFANPRPEIYSVVASMSFEVGVAFLIAINCVLLGWQASLPENENALLFDICEHIFVTIFLIEWCMRVVAFGWVWIFEFSNAADTVMVFIFGVFPKWILDPLGINATFIRVFTVMRALRLARLARAVRLKPAFKEQGLAFFGLEGACSLESLIGDSVHPWIFLEIDKDHSGELSFSEFENALNIPKVRQMLDVLGIQANELEEDLADTVKRLRLATDSAKKLLANADQFHSSLLHLEDECGRISDNTGRMVGLLNSHLDICNKQNIQREAARKKAKLKAAQEEAMRAEANQPEDEDEYPNELTDSDMADMGVEAKQLEMLQTLSSFNKSLKSTTMEIIKRRQARKKAAARPKGFSFANMDEVVLVEKHPEERESDEEDEEKIKAAEAQKNKGNKAGEILEHISGLQKSMNALVHDTHQSKLALEVHNEALLHLTLAMEAAEGGGDPPEAKEEIRDILKNLQEEAKQKMEAEKKAQADALLQQAAQGVPDVSEESLKQQAPEDLKVMLARAEGDVQLLQQKELESARITQARGGADRIQKAKKAVQLSQQSSEKPGKGDGSPSSKSIRSVVDQDANRKKRSEPAVLPPHQLMAKLEGQLPAAQKALEDLKIHRDKFMASVEKAQQLRERLHLDPRAMDRRVSQPEVNPGKAPVAKARARQKPKAVEGTDLRVDLLKQMAILSWQSV
eukprot:s198_g7.t4